MIVIVWCHINVIVTLHTVIEVSGIKSCTRIIQEKHKTMTQCQANAGPMLKAICHRCGSIGPMSSVSRYLLRQCGKAISHTMAHVNRDVGPD